jgi:hypothetical protein
LIEVTKANLSAFAEDPGRLGLRSQSFFGEGGKARDECVARTSPELEEPRRVLRPASPERERGERDVAEESEGGHGREPVEASWMNEELPLGDLVNGY